MLICKVGTFVVASRQAGRRKNGEGASTFSILTLICKLSNADAFKRQLYLIAAIRQAGRIRRCGGLLQYTC